MKLTSENSPRSGVQLFQAPAHKLRRLGAIGLAAVILGLNTVGAAQAASPRGSMIAARSDDVALATVLRWAERGNPKYQTQLGYMYEMGRGFPQDYNLAAQWYRRAAEQGYVRAQQLLGLLYDRGFGVPLDYVEAHKWLSLAAARAPSGDRDYFLRLRNAVASKLNRAEIGEAQRRATAWTLGLR